MGRSYFRNCASERLYQLTILRRCKASSEQLLQVYITQIRSVLEYACPVWHPGLTKEQCNSLESVQKRALRIILPGVDYTNALEALNIPSLEVRRKVLCEKLFKNIQSPRNKLFHLMPDKRSVNYNLRSVKRFELPKLRTKRGKGSFINWALLNLQ